MKPSILAISECRPIASKPTGQYFAVLLGALGAWAVASAAQFNPPIVIESPVPEREGWFGTASSVPDVTGDGRPEILICANGGAGGAYLYDGLSRQVIRELSGDWDWGLGIDDVNGDGRGDVIIVNFDLRRLDVIDGTTGGLIYTLEPAETSTTEVRAVSAVPDVNGDGRPEIAISLAGSETTVVKIYDGASGAELRLLSGAGLGALFGEPHTVSGIPDVNGDGRGDVIVGSPRANRAYIFDGATGALLRTLTGSGQFGRAVTGLNDVNGDGRGDVVVTAVESRRAYIYDGATGTLLRTLSAPGNPAYFGWFLNRLPDVDGDGRDDVVVAGPPWLGPIVNTGSAYVFSGVTGELLATLPRSSQVAGLPDVNGDGLAELLAANPLGDSTDGVYQAGQVLLYLSKPTPKPPEPAALGWSAEGFKVRLTGELDIQFELQSSEDLKTWSPVVKQTHTNKVTEFLDLDASNASRRFYRTRTVQ